MIGRPLQVNAKANSYAEVNRVWKKGDVVELVMDMPVRLLEAHPLAEEIRNQVVVKRGPLVYCLENMDIANGEKIDNVLIPADIKLTSICGQYLTANPNLNIQSLLSNSQLKPLKTKSKYQSKERYESGRIVPNGDDLLLAFAKLDKNGLGRFFTRDEYLECLSVLWEEIDKYYG